MAHKKSNPLQMLEMNDDQTVFQAYRLPDIYLYQFARTAVGTKDMDDNLRFMNRPAVYIKIYGSPDDVEAERRIEVTENLSRTVNEILFEDWMHIRAVVSPSQKYLEEPFEREQLRNILRYLFSDHGWKVADVDAIDERACDYLESCDYAKDLLWHILSLDNQYIDFYASCI